MPSLSNSAPVNPPVNPRVDASGKLPAADAIEYRRAESGELKAALRLLLGGIDGHTTDEQMMDFVAHSRQRGLDVRETRVAVRGGTVIWALLPAVSPGRTMLILSPPHAPTRASGNTDAVIELTDRVCRQQHKDNGIELAQMLLDPAEISLTQLYLKTGFIDLAELIYLQRTVKRMIPAPPLRNGLRLINYGDAVHAEFIETIARSYVASLDCPALNGLRDMENVIIGHKHSGEFDPNLWFLLMNHDKPLGVMLLNHSGRGDALEIVYLGLVPEARRHHLADVFMQLALISVVRQNKTQLTLAVDSRNAPALKLYQRHGMSRLGSRRALIRDLRPLIP
ncbi:MAG: GNAT family N-acetyltransferase [Phycisphaerae bacterium]|nr:GNAT family N-acetyltransferase [Phycisphaerae bacterium]